MNVIQGFLDHMKEIIANGDEDVNNYFHNWFAYLLQNPSKKNKTCLVVPGPQGAGKTKLFTNVWSKLVGRYANKNETSIKNITGDFNAGIENMKLIVINEVKNADTNQQLNSETLKTIITENSFTRNQKFEKVRQSQNVCNLIIVANDNYPIRADGDDRRYVISKASGKYVGNFNYFSKLVAERKGKVFFDNLFTYYMKMDLSKYDPRKIPMTEAKKDVLEVSKSSYELFVQDRISDFVNGWNCQEAWDTYKDWVQQNAYQLCSNKTFGAQIKNFCDRKRQSSGKRDWYYRLSFESRKLFDLSEVEAQAKLEIEEELIKSFRIQ
jgi:hypothetical protein